MHPPGRGPGKSQEGVSAPPQQRYPVGKRSQREGNNHSDRPQEQQQNRRATVGHDEGTFRGPYVRQDKGVHPDS